MKKICLLLLLCWVPNLSISQEPALTDNNWYIDYLFIDSQEYPSPIQGIGIIDPNIYFETDQMYGVVDPFSDSFFADIDYHPTDPLFVLTNMGITLPGCQAYCEFADLYFQLLAGDFIENTFEYLVVNNSDGSLTLTITDMEGDFAVFNDFPPLGVDSYDRTSFEISPNPVQETLHWNSEAQGLSATVYDLWGRQVQFNIEPRTSIDVSSLKSGTYLIMVETEIGRLVKRFIKR